MMGVLHVNFNNTHHKVSNNSWYVGDSIIRGTFSTWHVEKQNILESLKFLYKYFIRVLRVQKK